MSVRKITRNFKVNNVLTDPTSMVLSDSAATYGVKRTDTGAVVVVAGAAMVKVAVGIYEYDFVEPEENLDYLASIKILYNGAYYYYTQTITDTDSTTTTTTTTTASVSSEGLPDLANLLAAPAFTRTDEGAVRERTVDELIKADAYLRGAEAAANVPWGLRIAKTKPNGTVNDY